MAETSGTIKAVLTGHSRGLGAALAHELIGRNISTLGLSRGRLLDLHPGLQQVQLDLANSHALQNWLEGGHLEEFCSGASCVLLINNAGVVTPVGNFNHQHTADIASAIQLNVASALVLSAAAYRAKAPNAELKILHVSSGAARRAYAGWSTYCAGKAALDMHALCIAQDQLPDVKICSLAPGVIDTDMQDQIRNTPETVFPDRERFNNLKRNKELASPETCANQIVNYVLSTEFGKQTLADLRTQ